MAFYNKSLFISDINFQKLVEERSEDEPQAMYWRDLPINIVYRVDGIVPIKTKLSKEILLQLSDKDGYNISVWAPAGNLKKELNNLPGGTTTTYIKSLGQKECVTNNSVKRKYFDYQIVSV